MSFPACLVKFLVLSCSASFSIFPIIFSMLLLVSSIFSCISSKPLDASNVSLKVSKLHNAEMTSLAIWISLSFCSNWKKLAIFSSYNLVKFSVLSLTFFSKSASSTPKENLSKFFKCLQFLLFLSKLKMNL